MPLRIIERITCLWVRGLFGLSKDIEPKRHPNIWKKEKGVKENKGVYESGKKKCAS